jgi:ribosome-interacting GTPase 1
MEVHGAPIQILDLPGIIEGAKDGKGRGRQVIAVARTCNLIFLVLDVLKPLGDKAIMENELEGFGIRCNKQPPNITIKKKDKGGIAITNTQPLTKIDADEIKAVLNEYKMANCDVHIRCDPTVDEFIDVVEGGRVYIPVVYVLNKIGKLPVPRASKCMWRVAANSHSPPSQTPSRSRSSTCCTRSPTLSLSLPRTGSTSTS